ncbi:hypothetical protein BGZ99_005596 [Dissophora globulifera]|uniref:Uncharacterized protein n=1 Tax=Dissophora globulifera TaxID=979702 RepID=A0A9P6RGL5_9FUNG|nr:hypothetical protein BGZ99_005596 [Dissophora globulifera]
MNLLFQSTGKSTGSSSSSSATTSANPFQALTHFYEQELMDHQYDSRLGNSTHRQFSRHYDNFNNKHPASSPAKGHHHYQHQQYNHLFPTSDASSLSSSSSQSSTPLSSSPVHSSHRNSIQDEFRLFSAAGSPASGVPAVTPSMPSHVMHHHNYHGGARADISEYLKQRQEYYAREASIRRQDLHDGLGPIVDFSELFCAKYDALADTEGGVGIGGIKSRLEDHLEARHNNPYASKQQHHEHHQQQLPGMRAFSQQEQVLWDFQGRTASPTVPAVTAPPAMTAKEVSDDGYAEVLTRMMSNMDMDQAWEESQAPKTLSFSAANMMTLPSTAMTPAAVVPMATGSTPSTMHREAAESVHSSWPLPQWALETEAAFMALEGVHQQSNYHSQPQQEYPGRYQEPFENPTTTTGGWVEEYTQVLPTEKSIPALDSERPFTQDKGESLKTCGYMLDVKSKHDLLDPVTTLWFTPSVSNSPSMTPASLQQQHQQEDTPGAADPISKRTHLDRSAPLAMTTTAIEWPMLEEQMNPEPNGRMRQIYNDDTFEGEMLQAWMETLAQERQEANERAKSEEDEKASMTAKEEETEQKDDHPLDELQQKQVLKVAVRRLDALMHQLDRRQGAGVRSGKVVRATTAKHERMVLGAEASRIE